MDEEKALITWDAKLYEPKHKDVDWFWVLWFIVILVTVFVTYFGNYIFGIVVFMIGLTLSLYANEHMDEETFAITEKGIYIEDDFIPFSDIKSFWVFTQDIESRHKLLLTLRRTFFTHVALPLGDVDEEELRLVLRKYVLEKKQTPNLADEIMALIRF